MSVPSASVNRTCVPSTTWHFGDGTLAGTGVPYRQGRPVGASIFDLHSRDPRKPLDLQIGYRGGAEGTWWILARGWRWRFTGGLAIVDVMNWINRTDTP